MRPSSRAFGPTVAALLVVLALSLTAAPTLVPPARDDRSGGPRDALPPTSPSSGPITVAPAFAPGASTTWLGPVPPSTSMNVVVGLASQNPAGLEAETAAEYTVGSGLYHDFLSPSEVASLYGPAPASVTWAEQYFADFGLSTVPLGSGSLLSVSGPSSGLGAAFGTSFQEYRSPSGREFVSHPTPAVLPGNIPWTGAVGLGNASVPLPLAAPAPRPSPPLAASPAASCTGGTAGLSPCEVWTAYDAAGLINTGTNGSGTSIGIVDAYDGAEPQTQLSSDLAKFDSTFLLPAPSVGFGYPVPTSTNLNSTRTGWGLEEALDLEWAHAAAPGASIAMTFAPDTNAGLYEAVNWLVANDRVDVISLSWGEPDVGVYNAYSGRCASACNASADGSYEVLGPVLAAAALEGITVFSAAGDCGSADGTSGVSTNYPSSDPFVTGVGGTALSIGPGGVWQSETAWPGNSTGAVSPGCANQGGSGGGFAPFPRPWWQSGPGVPASPDLRGDPDVADDAATAVEIVEGGGAAGVLGTSVASPLWAGVAAMADQYAGGPLGYLDPQLYVILRSPGYSTDFHDITSGNNGAYSAAGGWDPVTGLGTPVVGALVPALSQAHPSTSSLKVGLSAAPVRGSAPLSVNFFLIPTGGSGDYPLEGVDFGDGTAALAPGGSVSHVYSTDGVYAAVAYVADSSGNVSASAPAAVVVGGLALSVTLTVSDLAPAVGASARLNATASGGTAPYSYLFAFGDGTFLNGSNSNTTTHSFAVAGGYCADVVATDSATPQDGGTSSLVPISVGGAAGPICTNQTGPFKVTADANPGVRDAPADYPALFRVAGGEGTSPPTEVLSSSDPYVGACQCTIFRNSGNYSVTLDATNASGSHATNETNVTVASPLTGTFSVQAGSGPLDAEFFVASLSGGYLAQETQTVWTFGDGASSVGAFVIHNYTSPGYFFATADTHDSGQGNASEGFLIHIDPPYGLVLVATVEPAVNVLSGATVNFTAFHSAGTDVFPPFQFNWSLGSGKSALGWETTATFYFPDSGSERAQDFALNVTSPLGSGNVSVRMSDPDFFAVQAGGFVPRADALSLTGTAGPGFGLSPLAWSGSATVSAPGGSALDWSFGNGNASSGASAHEQYDRPGDFTANVTANDSLGDTAVVPFGVAVRSGNPLSVQASVSPMRGAAPVTLALNASVTGGSGPPYEVLWRVVGEYGVWELDSAAGEINLTSSGGYNITLTAIDWLGDSEEQNWTIVVVSSNSTSPAGGGELGYLYLGIDAAVGLVLVAAVVRYTRRRPPPASLTP